MKTILSSHLAWNLWWDKSKNPSSLNLGTTNKQIQWYNRELFHHRFTTNFSMLYIYTIWDFWIGSWAVIIFSRSRWVSSRYYASKAPRPTHYMFMPYVSCSVLHVWSSWNTPSVGPNMICRVEIYLGRGATMTCWVEIYPWVGAYTCDRVGMNTRVGPMGLTSMCYFGKTY